ncbi:nitrous oxide reductase accessory protein NosL [Natronococcus wangiae]|uniref:nitrous oxide reductase accessory protein NosL n=1 Tax=Natronococcus wangiae TaxID=3068275 RepID=UPI00273E8F1F|nr:nitrous oxide reductase accessory protein NosL [Natronococcus sp. AD5]
MSPHDRRSLARRRFLGAIGAGTGVGVAGCIGDGGDEDETGGDGDNGDDAHPNEPHISEPGDEPLELSEDQNCVVCSMTPADYSDWHSQLAHETDERAIFCSSGCMTAYLAAPAVDSESVGAWTVDFETGELIDALEAHFVIVTDESGAGGDDVMGLNPRPFEDEDDAVAYLEEWDAEELTEDDIIGFDGIDADVASHYRPGRFPEE